MNAYIDLPRNLLMPMTLVFKALLLLQKMAKMIIRRRKVLLLLQKLIIRVLPNGACRSPKHRCRHLGDRFLHHLLWHLPYTRMVRPQMHSANTQPTPHRRRAGGLR